MTTAARQQTMTPERFSQGFTWTDWSAKIKANKEHFQTNYADFQVRPEEVEFFRQFNANKGPVKLVAIGEDWCGDVVRGLPVAVRLAEAAGLELRIFDRDENLDLMNEYLWRHEFLSIPVFAFFDKDWNELGHWIERPAVGYKFTADLRDELSAQNLSDEERTQITRRRREGVQTEWMHETIRELREQVLSRVL